MCFSLSHIPCSILLVLVFVRMARIRQTPQSLHYSICTSYKHHRKYCCCNKYASTIRNHSWYCFHSNTMLYRSIKYYFHWPICPSLLLLHPSILLGCKKSLGLPSLQSYYSHPYRILFITVQLLIFHAGSVPNHPSSPYISFNIRISGRFTSNDCVVSLRFIV